MQIMFQNNRTCAERSLGSHSSFFTQKTKTPRPERLSEPTRPALDCTSHPQQAPLCQAPTAAETNMAGKSLPLRTYCALHSEGPWSEASYCYQLKGTRQREAVETNTMLVTLTTASVSTSISEHLRADHPFPQRGARSPFTAQRRLSGLYLAQTEYSMLEAAAVTTSPARDCSPL